MSQLLDVNVLLALAWPTHQLHTAATRWFERESGTGWATCALTELSFTRLSSNRSFTEQPVPPLEAIALLGELRAVGKHVFWDAMPPVGSLSGLPLMGHQQLTDALLVKTAELHRGRLVTFDRGCAAHDRTGKRVVLLTP